jgi:hypothetical protein
MHHSFSQCPSLSRSFCRVGKSVRWIQNWLANRKQSVVIDGSTSDAVSVDSGVPQGSVLGPGLFLYYINFMHHSFSQCPSLSRSFCRVSASLLLDIVRYAIVSSANSLTVDVKLNGWSLMVS